MFTILENSTKAAAPMDRPKPNDITLLNTLALMNMQDIASADIISDLVNDYFITRPIGNNESDSDLCELRR